jgi:RNA polymerase sigma-70 factor (ECF subfamily)
MKAWLLTILRNQYYSELRHRKFEVEDPDDELASRVTVQPEHEALSTLEAVAIALKTMPTEQREALLLVCASGLSYRQAAVVCHCAIGTIKSRIARARDHLLEFLGLDESHTSRFDGSSHQHPRAPYGNATLFKRSALFPSARA